MPGTCVSDCCFYEIDRQSALLLFVVFRSHDVISYFGRPTWSYRTPFSTPPCTHDIQFASPPSLHPPSAHHHLLGSGVSVGGFLVVVVQNPFIVPHILALSPQIKSLRSFCRGGGCRVLFKSYICTLFRAQRRDRTMAIPTFEITIKSHINVSVQSLHRPFGT